jgi:hypothetical protein
MKGDTGCERTTQVGCETWMGNGTHFLNHSDASNPAGEVSISVAITKETLTLRYQQSLYPSVLGLGSPQRHHEAASHQP